MIECRIISLKDMVFLKIIVAGISFFGIYGIILLLTKETFVQNYVVDGILKKSFLKKKGK